MASPGAPACLHRHATPLRARPARTCSGDHRDAPGEHVGKLLLFVVSCCAPSFPPIFPAHLSAQCSAWCLAGFWSPRRRCDHAWAGMGTPMCARQRRASDVPRRMGTPSRAGSCRASEERKRADARKHAQAFSLPSVPALRGAQGVRAAVSGVSATACSAQVSTLCPSACVTPCPALGTRSCPRACGAGAALTRLAMGAVGARSPPPRNAAGRCRLCR